MIQEFRDPKPEPAASSVKEQTRHFLMIRGDRDFTSEVVSAVIGLQAM